MSRIQCYRGRWPEPDVPSDAPTWLYYEVDTDADNVLRMVEVFADGRVARDSIALEERKGDQCPSLIEDSFMAIADQLEIIPAAAFEELYQRGTDTPVWFPDGYPRPAQA